MPERAPHGDEPCRARTVFGHPAAPNGARELAARFPGFATRSIATRAGVILRHGRPLRFDASRRRRPWLRRAPALCRPTFGCPTLGCAAFGSLLGSLPLSGFLSFSLGLFLCLAFGLCLSFLLLSLF